ncbi:MAG: pilin [Candidatus Paceibacteria bacterium]
MKKLFLSTIAVFSLFGFLLNPSLAAAQQDPSKRDPLGVGYGQKTGLSNTDPRIIVGRIIQVGLGLLGVVAFVLIVYGGFMIMTAAGNEEKVETGKNILLYAVIGLAIILSAYSITSYVISELYTATQGQLYKP